MCGGTRILLHGLVGPAILLAVACTFALPVAAQQAPATDKPNIVLFIADDLSIADMGSYGNAAVRTPNVDRLAREGLRFTHAFAGSPTCTPSRCVMYTGLFPLRNGAHPNHSEIRPGTKTIGYHLQARGYRVVLAGKQHINPLDAFGFEYLEAALPQDPDFPRDYRQEGLDTDAIDRLLADHRANRGDTPLCLIIAAWAPHVKWRYQDYDPAKVIVPPYMVDTPLTRRAISMYYSDVTVMDKRLGACLASLEKHGFVDNTLLLFTSDQGAQFPHAKWNVYDAGIRTPLIVRFPGKVQPGSTTAAMVSLADLMPTFIAVAGGIPPTDIDGRSFLPVILGQVDEHRGVIFASHTGDGRMNDFPSRCIRTRTHKYILNLKPQNVYTTHISKGRDVDGRDYWESWVELAKTDAFAARVVNNDMHRPAEELYDLRSDPYEMNNIASDPASAELLATLRRQMVEWRKQQGDEEPTTRQ